MSDTLKHKRIVVVEDDELTAQSLHDYFCDTNDVTAYNSGEALLENVERHRDVDIFILDYRLPGIDGAELFLKLKHSFPAAKFISISGEMSMELASRINEIGFDALLLKPFDFAILEKNITSLTVA